MKALVKATFVLLLLGCIAGCSRKKDTFLNRNWHAVTAEYNTLYNGNLALEQGKLELNANYFDNYWEILPIERMHLSEEIMLPGYSHNPNFEIAEEKAVKAIQRHSMLIGNSEKNPQMDEAYLLLGKARYFDQRFVPALEAFNYVLHKYPLSTSINQANIWREKTNMRLEFNELAIRNLNKILEREGLKDQDRADAAATLSQAYINETHLDSALVPLKIASRFTKKNEEKGRYHFIQGQLYDVLGKQDSAKLSFEEVIALNRKSPRIYMINAQLAILKIDGNTPEGRAAGFEILHSMAKDRENRPFLDKIFFQMAEFHSAAGNTELAATFYNRSLSQPSDDRYLQAISYESLGNINFDAARYPVAGAYYDSTLSRLSPNTRIYRTIERKRENLGDVIQFENIASVNDSILHLVNLPEEKRLEFFSSHTERLKEEARASMAQVATNQSAGGSNLFEDRRPAIPGVPDPSNSFYFYNPTTVAYGKQQFARLWGNIELTDNWRYGNQMAAPGAAEELVVNEEVLFENNPIFDPQTYINQIPTDPQVVDSLSKERNFAYYQLGMIYSGKFKEYGLAAERLEILLDSDPEERLVLPATYHLYKVYQEMGETQKAEDLRQVIVTQYPESRYAIIIQDPESILEGENTAEVLYEELAELHEDQQYEEVIHQSDQLILKFTGDPIVPKLEFLKAKAMGRLMGYDAYKEALNYLALNYPQSDEGKEAQQVYDEAIPALADERFVEDGLYSSFKLIYPFRKAEVADAQGLQRRLVDTLKSQKYRHLELSSDVYDQLELFVVVHGFRSPEAARLFSESVPLEPNREQQPFIISSGNYSTLQIHKNKENYLQSINQPPQ